MPKRTKKQKKRSDARRKQRTIHPVISTHDEEKTPPSSVSPIDPPMRFQYTHESRKTREDLLPAHASETDLRAIRKDLLKTILYSAAAFVVLVVLSYYLV